MAAPGSDIEELLEVEVQERSSAPCSFPRRLAVVFVGLILVVVGLLLQKDTRGLRRQMGGFVDLQAEAEPCLEMGMFYADPHKMDNTERTVEDTAEACQQRCAQTDGCAHFTFWPDGGCLLTDATSTAKAAAYKYSDTVSGPASCGDSSVSPAGVASGIQAAVDGATDAVSQSVQALVAPAPGVNGSSCSAYPACVAVGISEGNCCPNDDKVALGCCNGFPPKVVEVKIAAGSECSAFPACARMNMTGACCPAADGIRLSCCDAITSV